MKTLNQNLFIPQVPKYRKISDSELVIKKGHVYFYGKTFSEGFFRDVKVTCHSYQKVFGRKSACLCAAINKHCGTVFNHVGVDLRITGFFFIKL